MGNGSTLWYDQTGPAHPKNGRALPTVDDLKKELSVSEAMAQAEKELAEIGHQAAATVTEDSAPKVTTSRIRVLLNRPLTWAEKEDLETNWDDEHARRVNETVSPYFKLHVADNHEHIWAEAGFGSRILFELIAAAVEQHFVNVYPKAVRTFREYNGE